MKRTFSVLLLICLHFISCKKNPFGSPLKIESGGVTTIDTDFYKRKTVDLLSVKSCEGCHKEETEEWKSSGHGRSWNNPVFKLAFQKEPAKWCVNCHAPIDKQMLASVNSIFPLPGGEVKLNSESKLTNEGINCAVCHVRDGKIYASKKPTPSAIRLSIHPIEVDETLSKTEFCASCHEFPFPKREVLNNPNSIQFHKTMMQSTVSEFQTSHQSKEGKTCQTCHFQKGNTKNSFHGSISFNTDLYPMQFSFENKNNEFIVFLKINNVGHVWPTGDYFRQIRIHIKKEDGNQNTFLHVRTPNSLTEPKWGHDFRLHPNQSTIQTEYNVGKSKPTHCSIEMHKQCGIQNLITKEVGRKEYESTFVRKIYDGPCTQNQEPSQ